MKLLLDSFDSSFPWAFGVAFPCVVIIFIVFVVVVVVIIVVVVVVVVVAVVVVVIFGGLSLGVSSEGSHWSSKGSTFKL